MIQAIKKKPDPFSFFLSGKHIFKLPRESGAELIVDEDFRRAVEGNGLKGLQFRELPQA